MIIFLFKSDYSLFHPENQMKWEVLNLQRLVMLKQPMKLRTLLISGKIPYLFILLAA